MVEAASSSTMGTIAHKISRANAPREAAAETQPGTE